MFEAAGVYSGRSMGVDLRFGTHGLKRFIEGSKTPATLCILRQARFAAALEAL